jgi:hypothetical protein
VAEADEAPAAVTDEAAVDEANVDEANVDEANVDEANEVDDEGDVADEQGEGNGKDA